MLSGAANRLTAFEDFPKAYDAWEITNYYKEKSYAVKEFSEVESVDFGCDIGFRIRRDYGKSVIIQTVTISPYSKEIKVENKIDWHERHTLLKAFFPAAVNADRAVYEIQYGHVTRPTHENTSWDSAKFEVCAHKYADISEHGYGLAILNDCKYGYSATGTELALTLLKSATHPNPEADQGIHEFTYVILPHEGDFRDAGVVRAAYCLNQPIKLEKAYGKGEVPSSFSPVSADRKNIVIESVKAAEEGNGIIVRLYDAFNMKTETELDFGFDISEAYLCDMEENELSSLPVENGRKLSVKVGSFEIITVKVIKK